MHKKITVYSRQRAIRVRIEALQQFAERALAECVKIPGITGTELERLEEISVILVSDRRMAGLHRKFLQLAGATDVITFQHGEVVVSLETAQRNARRFGNSLEQEVRRNIAHGLLHLHRFNDNNSKDAAEMETVQKRLVEAATKAKA